MDESDKISWSKFQNDNKNVNEAFQTLALRLMSYELGKPSWHFKSSKTYPGIECEPEEIKGEFHSFQAKFYSNTDNGWKKLISSLNTTCKHIEQGNYSLDILHVFVNWNKPVKKYTKKESSKKSKVEQCEEIAEKGGFTITWIFGDQIIERFQNDSNAEVKKIKRQFFKFSSQPTLNHPINIGSKGIAKYHYAANSRLEYVERIEVSTVLNELINDEREFLWHTIIGSAGVGKSRSILEFCKHKLDDTWKWGWLRVNCDHDFINWRPDSNHIIVVDYAMGRGNQLFKLLEDCITRTNKFLFRVRVIVAERMIEPWIQEITGQPTNGAAIADAAFRINESTYTPLPTKIKPFKNKDQIRLAEIALKKYPKLTITKEELVKKVLEVDELFRPLLVWLCVDHLSRNEDLRYAQDILENYINHQRIKNWQPNGVSQNDELNTALVTMCQGLSESLALNWKEEAHIKVARIDIQKHSIILGAEQEENTLRPMEPDIVGELFALNTCIGNNPLDFAKAKELMSNSALLNPKGLVGFLFRAASDFPSHEAFNKMLKFNLNPELKIQIIHFLILGLNKPGPSKDRKKIRIFLNEARNVALKHSTLNSLQNYAATVTNASHGFTDIEDITLIVSHIDSVRLILDGVKDSLIIRAYLGAVQNLFAGDRLDPLMHEEKMSYMKDACNLTNSKGFTQDSLRTLIGILSSLFSSTVMEDEFDPEGNSRAWLTLFESLLKNKFSEDEHISAVTGNMLRDAADKMHTKKNYDAHSTIIEKVIELNNHLREQEITQIASQLFSYCQALNNGGSPNPDSFRLLDLLAKINEHAKILYKSIH